MSEISDEYSLDHLEPLDTSVTQMPIVLLVDTSPSMEGGRIGAVNEGLIEFNKDLQADINLASAVDIAIVGFGGNGAERITPFTFAADFSPPQIIIPDGNLGTPLSSGIKLAVALLEERKAQYDRDGVNRALGWIVTMSDGAPNPNDPWEAEAQRLVNLESNRKLMSMPYCVDSLSHAHVMAKLSKIQKPRFIAQDKIVQHFKILSKSLRVQGDSIRTGQAAAIVDTEDTYHIPTYVENASDG